MGGASSSPAAYSTAAAVVRRCRTTDVVPRQHREGTDVFVLQMSQEALNALSAEERHRLYKRLRLEVVANPDRSLEMNGALGKEFVQSEPVSRDASLV